MILVVDDGCLTVPDFIVALIWLIDDLVQKNVLIMLLGLVQLGNNIVQGVIIIKLVCNISFTILMVNLIQSLETILRESSAIEICFFLGTRVNPIEIDLSS
jgi:hypothetical protein